MEMRRKQNNYEAKEFSIILFCLTIFDCLHT